MHSRIPVPSLWRVFPITLSSQTDMPSLYTVTLKGHAFKNKKTIHTKSPSPAFPSSLDITPALQYYLSFPVSFTHSLTGQSSPLVPPSRVMWSNSTSSSDPVEVKLKGLTEHLHFSTKSPKIAIPGKSASQVWESILSTPTQSPTIILAC